VAKVGSPNLGLYYALGNVDGEAYQRFCEEQGEATEEDLAWAAEAWGWSVSEADPAARRQPLLGLLRRAWEAGEFRYVRQVGKCFVRVNMKVHPALVAEFRLVEGRTGTAGAVDFSEAQQVTLMEREHRELVYGWAQFLRKHVPGFENSFLLTVSPYLNARGGRYLDSEYALSHQDLQARRCFSDVIYLYHDDKSGLSCEVPYRMLLPRRIDGLLAAGRASHVYGPNLRARCFTMLNGQAAGVAAALCVREGVEPRRLDVVSLQRSLLELGSPVTYPHRLKELGLA
jgi:hypothetical protein